MRLKTFLFSLLILLAFSCAKNKPNKHILGQWEVISVDSKEAKNSDPQIFEDFKNDLSYFKNITFYPDSLYFIDYLNTESRLGTYYIEENQFGSNSIYTGHFPLNNIDSTQQHKFNFFLARYDIKKFTRNKLIVTTDYLAANDMLYNKLTIILKKIGKFE